MKKATIIESKVVAFDEKSQKATIKEVEEKRIFNSIKTANKEVRESKALFVKLKEGDNVYLPREFAESQAKEVSEYFEETLNETERKDIKRMFLTALENACIIERLDK